jgi:Winged helix DNA-binding domain
LTAGDARRAPHRPAARRSARTRPGGGRRAAARRAGLRAIAAELDERADGLVDLARREPPAELPPPRLLGAFDALLMGWTSRAPILGAADGIVTTNGIFRPFALVRGRATATWRLAAGAVELAPFARLARADAAALERDARDVMRFLGRG